MNIDIGKWCFKPRPLSSLLALIFFCLFIYLGLWQLGRVEYKRTVYKDFLNRQDAEPVNTEDLIRADEYKKYFWRHVVVSGAFEESIQVLLDNQVKRGRSGYFVYTPIHLSGESDVWALVNRGWVAAGFDRNQLPELIRTDSNVSFKAVIKELPKTGMRLKQTEPELMMNGVYRVNRIELAGLEKIIHKKLLPIIIRMQPGTEDGYVREWRIPGSGEQVHQGYAFQWFAFAATLLVIYFVVNTKRSTADDGSKAKK